MFSSCNTDFKSLDGRFDKTSWKNIPGLFHFVPPKDRLFRPSNHSGIDRKAAPTMKV